MRARVEGVAVLRAAVRWRAGRVLLRQLVVARAAEAVAVAAAAAGVAHGGISGHRFCVSPPTIKPPKVIQGSGVPVFEVFFLIKYDYYFSRLSWICSTSRSAY